MRAVLRFRALLPAVFALALASCAVSGGTDSSWSPAPLDGGTPVSPMRDLMQPEHRVFYDMLEGQGDWVLIEPYGYVFRPDVNFVAWRPYSNGYWAASDNWGWVWVSADDFGWATDHYGRWMNDRFQGWVWIPDTDWGPAWVQWAGDDEYVGWAPMLAASSGYTGGAYTFVPVSALPATDLGARVVKPEIIQPRLGDLRPIERTVERGGVTAPVGPSIEWVEGRVGPVARARLQDVVAPGSIARERPRPARERADTAPRDARARDSVRAERTKRAEAAREAERVADQARDRTQRGEPAPSTVPVVRPFEDAKGASGERPARPPREGRGRRGAAADSTR